MSIVAIRKNVRWLESLLAFFTIFLLALFPNLEVIARLFFHTGMRNSTAFTHHMVLVLAFIAAAIASRRAAEIRGMQIISENIQDIAENYTRFLLISRQALDPAEADKTSVVFAMKNIAGALYKSLSAFALRDIDLCKIESRPWRGRPFEYIFYLDFRGTPAQQHCRNALRHLEEMTSFLKILGSYPEGEGHNPPSAR